LIQIFYFRNRYLIEQSVNYLTYEKYLEFYWGKNFLFVKYNERLLFEEINVGIQVKCLVLYKKQK
jgi:hypothetical protein